MNCQGSIKTVEEIERVLLGWNDTRLIKDSSKATLNQKYQSDNSTNYIRVYEVYIGWYVFIIRLYFDKRVGSEKGRFSVADSNRAKLFNAVHGLKEQVDKMTPMSGQWQPLELDTITQNC